MKISFIGAGSIGFTQTLVRDLLKVPEFQDITFSFHDISEKNLDLVSRLIQKDIEQKTQVLSDFNRVFCAILWSAHWNSDIFGIFSTPK